MGISLSNTERVQYGIVGSQHRIKINTKISLGGATCIIKYRKPDGTTGDWSAEIDGSYIYYDPATTSIINLPGKWFLYAHVTKAGVVYMGKTVVLIVQKPGTDN